MKPTIQEIVIAKIIVKDLIDHNFFDAIIDVWHEDSFADWRANNREYLKERNITLFTGATKVCISSKALPNWVIKVSFTYPNEEETSYCDIEATNYQDAIKKGLDEFFAATYHLIDEKPSERYRVNSVGFYIQERAEPNEEKTSATCCGYIGHDDGDDWDRLETFFHDSGKLDELFSFIKDWDINDLHSGNFGYTKEGKVKVIDFSGY